MPDIARHAANEEAFYAAHLAELEALERARKRNRIEGFFMDNGPLRRELYAKHVKMFAAGGNHAVMPECPPGCDGSPHRERSAISGNRTGKTIAASYETALHLTGVYPDWWTGLRFTRPIIAWACGITNIKTRDVNQLELLGPYNAIGTGMIPNKYIIGSPSPKSGIPQAVESARIKHTSGGTSYLYFKSYEQGWEAFVGSAIHFIWLDEEPPENVYTECCIRTMTTQGQIVLTFTPLQGVTEVVKSYLDAYQSSIREGLKQ